VLHTFEELRSTGDQVVRLLQAAKQEQDWELCKELARFLMALDETGATLQRTLELVELKTPSAEPEPGYGQAHFTFETTRLSIPTRGRAGTNGYRRDRDGSSGSRSSAGSSISPGGRAGRRNTTAQEPTDYFGVGLGSPLGRH
jgi:hypothetical protein